MADLSRELAYTMTLDANITATEPLLGQMSTYQSVTNFLDTNLIAITAFLAVLSTLLIYSLMLSDVEQRTFEFGMLRALGFNTKNVMTTVILQAFLFAIPGVVFGLSFAAAMNAAIRYVLFNLAENKTNYLLTPSSIVIGVCTGIFIPLIANYAPISVALGKNLRNSLDQSRRAASEITVKMT